MFLAKEGVFMDASYASIDLIKGIGPKTLKELEKLNIKTIKDLYLFYPTRYEIYTPNDIYNLKNFDKVCLAGKIISALKFQQYKTNLSMITFNINVNGEIVKVIIFNRRYLLKLAKAGMAILVSGKYNYFKKELIATNIFLNESQKHCEVFYKTKEINAKLISSSVFKAYQMGYRIKEYLPTYLLNKHQFKNINDLLPLIHHPSSYEEIKMVNNRRKYEEVLNFFICLEYYNSLKDKQNRNPIDYDIALVKEFIKTIPFELSVDQKKVCNEIFTDFKKPYPMNRLIEGDVGSGKTIVAVIASLAMYTAKKQVAIMVPTEILAHQHYETFVKFLSPFGVDVSLYTASISTGNRNIISKNIREGKTDIIIGTHALFYGKIAYHDLGLAIIDEQHRFGVDARSKLLKANPNADALYLSATPIPRTLALTLFSDLSLSVIKSSRSNKKPIKTIVLSTDDINEMFDCLKREIANGHQAYFVVSSISSSFDDGRFDISDVLELVKQYDNTWRVLALHGKMRDEEKNEIMTRFIRGEADILVSTTVIEVGISVDNATIMVVLDAHNFGLAALHQLRGRVGRGNLNGYCYLITTATDTARLQVLKESNDGFYLAEEDLKMRGPGDYFGMRQSGDLSFLFADLEKDQTLFVKTKEEVKSLYLMASYDPEIRSYISKIIDNLNLNDKLN